jgi:magnesium chelatase subunit I
VAAVTGKVELVYEGEQEGAIQVARHLIGTACRTVFDRYFPDAIREGSNGKSPNKALGKKPRPEAKNDRYKPTLDWFAAGNRLELSADAADEEYSAALEAVPGLVTLAEEFLPSPSRIVRATVLELILEGLHQHSLLAKEDVVSRTSYSDMLGVMLEGLK